MMMGDSFLLHSELIYGQRLTIVHTIVHNGGLLVLVTEKVYHRNDVRKNFTEFYLWKVKNGLSFSCCIYEQSAL